MFSLFKNIFKKSTGELQQVLQNGAVIVDVRTKPEFDQGHIPGSKNIPLNEIERNIDMISKWNQPVITVCRSGHRSVMAQAVLQAAGIVAYNGGAWTSLNK